MKHKFIAAFGAALVTLGTFGATAAEPNPQATPSMEATLGFCKASYTAHKEGRDLTPYKKAAESLSPENRKIVITVCMVYAIGFEDGTAWKGNAT